MGTRSQLNTELRRALRENYLALFDIALAAWGLGRFAEALVYADAAATAVLETNIPRAPASILLAEILTHLRRYEDAERLLTPILDQSLPSGGHAAEGSSLPARRIRVARRSFFTALDAMGTLEERRGCFEAAARCYQRYIDADPDSPKGYLMLGMVLCRQGKLSEAEANLTQAAKCDDADEVVQREIGYVLCAQGRLAEAREAFAAALAIDPEFESVKHCLEDIDAALKAENSL